LSSQSKNKIQNILSAEFDYSDDESGDENKTAVDITAIPQEQIDKTTESLFKNSKILDEIRSIYYENGGNDLHGSSSSKYDDRDRKRKRSRSSSRDKTSDRRRERRRSKERERSRSHRRRSSSPPRHRDDKRDKERRKLGLPTEPKKEHLIIGSRTLWLGRLPQNCQENQIRKAMEEFGTIERVQVIQSRICAYVTMSGIY
jgi:RNA recognition motif-containing protein